MIEKLTGDKFESATASGVAVIDFFAEWCGPCHEMAPVIEAISNDFADAVKVYKVDVDSEQQLAVRFGIQSIPTIFILKDGKLAGQFVGITAKQKLEDAIRKALGIA